MITLLIDGIAFVALEHACRNGELELLNSIRFPGRPDTLVPQQRYAVELSPETADRISEHLAGIARNGVEQFYGRIRLSELIARWEKVWHECRQVPWRDRVVKALAVLAALGMETAMAV